MIFVFFLLAVSVLSSALGFKYQCDGVSKRGWFGKALSSPHSCFNKAKAKGSTRLFEINFDTPQMDYKAAKQEILATDEEMAAWLEDMIYSGDIEGYFRRNKAQCLSEDFFDYVDEKKEECEDEDEKGAIQEILTFIGGERLKTDGNADSGEVREPLSISNL